MKLNVIDSFFNTKWWRYVTLEPAMVLYFTSYVTLDFVNTNLYLQKACRHNATVEPSLDTPCDDETRGITFVASVNSNYKFALVTLMVMTAILATSWSDGAGKRRKPLIVVPIIGQILQICSSMVQAYCWHWPPLAAVISDVVFQVICGGHLLLLNCSFIYICDISNSVNRTMKVGILSALQVICLPIGSGISGVLIHNIGFLKTYFLCLVTTVVALIFALALIKDVTVPVEKKPTICSTLNPANIVDCFKLVFKKSLGSKRWIIAILLAIHVTVWFSYEGEKTVFYLYIRHRFNWNEQTFSYYLAYKLFGIMMGTCFCSIFLSRYLKIHDGLIGTFAGFWDTLAALAFLFATETWQIYLIPLLDIFHGSAIAIRYSFITKFFQPEEFGRLYSAVNVFSLIIPICHPVYNITFKTTLNTFPSAYYMISVVVDIIVCILYGLTYYLCKKEEAKESSLPQSNAISMQAIKSADSPKNETNLKRSL